MNQDHIKSELLALAAMPEPTRDKPSYPDGWKPGVQWDGKKGTITTGTLTEAPTDWGPLLKARGLDPDIYEVVGDSIKWCSYDGWKRDEKGEDAYSAICFSYRAEIRLKRPAEADLELTRIFDEIRKAKPKIVKPAREDAEPETFVANLSDWQIGNGDAGGIVTQLEALAALPDLITDRFKALRKLGRNLERAVVAGVGDLGEGCSGFYHSQEFLTELDRREQSRVVRRGIVDIVKACAGVAPQVTVTGVGGNHGENRQGGKRFTGFGDNDDVAVFEQVAEIFAESAYGNVNFLLPRERLAIAMNLHGQIVAWTHGHLPNPGKNAAETMWGWWKDNAMGRFYPSVADANILVCGHYHHFNAKQQEGRTVLICPSLTAVGDWYSNARGVQTVPGTLSFCVNAKGWNSIEVLS